MKIVRKAHIGRVQKHGVRAKVLQDASGSTEWKLERSGSKTERAVNN